MLWATILKNKVVALTSLLIVAGVLIPTIAPAHFAPGDIYKEYHWAPSNFLRVGGQLDYGGGNMNFGGAVDLTGATKAEVYIAKLLCHDATVGLAVAVNNNSFIKFPEGAKIASPQSAYQHMIYPTVSVPLSQLQTGTNQFKLKVDPTGWWPQNLIYGCLLRVYYGSSKAHPSGTITSPSGGGTMNDNPVIEASVTGTIVRADFIAKYEDFNYEGDGEYNQWHYTIFKGGIRNHLGTATSSPYKITCNTAWVPDQTAPVQIMARLRGSDGTMYNTPAVSANLVKAGGTSVALFKPYNIPQKWVTRKGTKTANFTVSDANVITKALAGRLMWVGWASNYMNGVGINNKLLITKDPTVPGSYTYHLHKVPMTATYIKNSFTSGTNSEYATGTSSSDHGMEINWPAMVPLIQYTSGVDNTPPTLVGASAPEATKVSVTFNEPVSTATATATGNYGINNGITVSAAALVGNTVNLTTSTLTKDVSYTVTVNNVEDLKGNAIAANSTANFTYVPFEGWQEDFNDGVADGFVTGGGSWSVSGNEYGNSGSGRMEAWYGGQKFTDITFTADVTPGSGTDVWVIFRVQDKDNYLLFTLGNSGKGALYRIQNGSYSSMLAAGTGSFAAGTKYAMEVTLSGSSITIKANGSTVLTHSDNTWSDGYVGFGANGNTGKYDNCMVPSGSTGLPDLVRADTKAAPQLSVEPHPFTPGAGLNIHGVMLEDIRSISIHTLAGETVKAMDSGYLKGNQLQWDGTNAAGQALPDGMYFLRVNLGSRAVGTHLMLIR